MLKALYSRYKLQQSSCFCRSHAAALSTLGSPMPLLYFKGFRSCSRVPYCEFASVGDCCRNFSLAFESTGHLKIRDCSNVTSRFASSLWKWKNRRTQSRNEPMDHENFSFSNLVMEIIIYEDALGRDRKAYFNLQGKAIELCSGDIVQLNGWYATKLGLKDGEPLPLRRIRMQVSAAQQVQVEPLSTDDWEILEKNAGRVETVLLDQVRVVWKGQILPVWIQKSICVYLKVGDIKPEEPCVVLENNTEVHVAPKLRASVPPSTLNLPSKSTAYTSGQAQKQRQLQSSLLSGRLHQYKSMDSPNKQMRERDQFTSSSEYENVDILEPKPLTASPLKSPRSGVKKNSAAQSVRLSSSLVQRQSSLMDSFMRYLPSIFMPEKREPVDNLSNSDKDSFIGFSMKNLPSRNAVLRVQSMGLIHKLSECFSFSKAELNKQIVSQSMFGFRNSVRQPSFKENLDDQKNYNIPLEVFQPSTVYIDAEFTKNERLIHPYLPHLPDNFIARLQKLPSPQEKAAGGQKTGKQVKTGKAGQINESSKADIMEGIDSGNTNLGTGDVTTIAGSCYVRVVAIDRKAGLTDKVWQKGADHVLSNQPLLHGHVIIPDLLRRQLHLETTGLVWIQTGAIDFVIPRKIHIYLLSALPKTVHNDLIIMAFINYIRNCADEEHPLVVFQGIFLRFVVFPDVIAEVQLTFFGDNDLGNIKAVTMLSESNIDLVQIVLERGEIWEDKMNVVNKMLPYCQTVDFDPVPILQKLKQLGGVDSLVQQALLYLHASLASRPLSRYSFQVRGGLSHGILLITGPKGCGKSSLVKGLCRKMGHPPVLAYVTLLDCKTLRGKTVATIQKILEMTFDEAAWREPAVVVLENLDVIVPAASGPETEVTGEALYSTKIAQVLENVVRYEIENNSRVTVIATSTSRASLHPSLISSRGTHCVQHVLNIGSPDKHAREKILQSILQRHSSVTADTVKTLDTTSIAVKTEGFVARDLELLVNRTLHIKMSSDREGFSNKFTLTTEDFEETLSSFKPVSVRNVPLHKAGDAGWLDVGGLSSVKTVLMETLKWPTKYPQLFSSCPLRLRSGILLYGAPGTGKTLLAGVVAKECGLNFISVKGPEVLNKYIGASEQAVRDLFTKAQSAKPCILFFDEFDSIAPKRGHDSTGVTDRVVNQLLTQLDGVEGLQGVYVLAATSRPDLIDPALLRPGRLDICLNCAIPDEDERYAILEAHTHKMCLAADVNLREIAAICEHFTGADLKALLYNAQLKVIHEHTDGDQVMNESVVWIKGDSNQCGARRASVVRNETGVIKMSLSKSFSENSSGGRSPSFLDQQSPKQMLHCAKHRSSQEMINVSGNSSVGRSPCVQHECDMNCADGLGIVVKDSIATPKGMLCKNIFQYPDVELVSGDKAKQHTRALLDGEKDFQVINNKLKRITSLTLAKSTSSPELLPSAQVKVMSAPAKLDFSQKHFIQDIHSEHSSLSEAASDWSQPEQTKESQEAADSDLTSADVPVAIGTPLVVAQGGVIPYDDVDGGADCIDGKVTAECETNSFFSTPKQPRKTNFSSYRKRRSQERAKIQGNQNNLIISKTVKSADADIRSPSVDKPVTVFPTLARGLATLTVEDEARYLAMVKLIQHRDEVLFEAANAKRRTSLMLESKSSVLMEVSQRHLVKAAKTMRPSVSASERERYLRIYDNFVSSRKGGFEKVQEATIGKRATLA